MRLWNCSEVLPVRNVVTPSDCLSHLMSNIYFVPSGVTAANSRSCKGFIRHSCQSAERASEAAQRADAELAAMYAEKCVMYERCRTASVELAAAGEQLLDAREELRRMQRCGARAVLPGHLVIAHGHSSWSSCSQDNALTASEQRYSQ